MYCAFPFSKGFLAISIIFANVKKIPFFDNFMNLANPQPEPIRLKGGIAKTMDKLKLFKLAGQNLAEFSTLDVVVLVHVT